MLLATKICCRTFCPGVGLIWLPPLGLLAGNATHLPLFGPSSGNARTIASVSVCVQLQIYALRCKQGKHFRHRVCECEIRMRRTIVNYLQHTLGEWRGDFDSIRFDSMRFDSRRYHASLVSDKPNYSSRRQPFGRGQKDPGPTTQDPVPRTSLCTRLAAQIAVHSVSF